MSIYTIFFSIAVASVLMSYPDDSAHFVTANTLYFKGEYNKALDLYGSINNKGTATWYNMGNCAYKLKDYTSALIYWNCAKKDSNAHEYDSLAYNIAVAQQKLEIDTAAQQVDHLSTPLYNNIRFIPLLIVQLLFIFMWLLLFFFIKRNNRGKKNTLIISTLCMMSIVCMVFLRIQYTEMTLQKGIIMKKNSELFAGPCQDYHKIVEIPQASVVTIMQKNDAWVQIAYKDVIGWVLTDALMIV